MAGIDDRYEEFVDVWMDAVRFRKSQTWISEQLGIARSTVVRTADNLRRKGVELPRLFFQQEKVDVEKLNQIIKERTK